jgi:GMP synthase-like glutamine amidotransferase
VRLLVIVHQPDAGPGVFAQAMQGEGAELVEWSPPAGEAPDLDGFDGVLTFGGAMNPDEGDRHHWLRAELGLLGRVIARGTPLLGVCLGAELVAQAAGGEAPRAHEPEIGWHTVELTDAACDDQLLGALPRRFEAFQWHSYTITPPDGGVELARSEAGLQAFRVGDAAWAIQFHAEVALEDAEAWIDDYRSDADAVRIQLDADALRAETRGKIAAWNELGRALAARFARIAAASRE